MPKVSVIVPVYGVAKFIKRCANSLFSQTLDDIEYLFIDDCSPDNSIEILKQVLEGYPQREPQVIIHQMEKNSGVAAVREWGICNATGDYIIYCDSDDWVQPEMYQLMYERAVCEKADYVLCDYNTTDGSRVYKTVVGCTTTNKKALLKNLLSLVNTWAVWNKLVKRSCYNDIVFPIGNNGEDMCLSIQLLLNATHISYVSKALYNYNYNPNSITNFKNVEHEFNKFCQFCMNVDVVSSVINNHPASVDYSDSIIALKWKARKNIWRLCYDDYYFRIWKETYPEINKRFFSNPSISKGDKLRYVMTYLRLYPKKKDLIKK